MAKLDDRGLVDDGIDDLEITGNLVVRGVTSISSTTTFSLAQKTSGYTLTLNDYTVECTTGSFTLTLPTAVTCEGKVFVLKNSGSGIITIATTLSQTIDGQTSGELSQYDCLNVQSNGSNWIII